MLRNAILVVVLLLISEWAYNFLKYLLPMFTIQIMDWTNMDYAQIFAIVDIVWGIGSDLAG